MKIYLDTCCLNRPYDDLSDNTVRLESEAVLAIIDICESGGWVFFSSDVLLDEILGITNIVKREKVLLLYHSATMHINLTDDIVTRAREFERFQIKPYDALQLSSAEIGGADVFLTTDRQLISAAGRSDVKIKVMNPLIWLTEVLYER